MTFPQFINTMERTVQVLGFISETDDYLDGKAYLDESGYVWIFCESEPSKTIRNKFPYFWKSKELEFSDPDEEVRNNFHVSKLKDLSRERIENESHEDEINYDEKTLNDINSALTVFVPTIKKKDDFLKKLVKTMILEKNTNVKRYRSKSPKAWTIGNMINSLNSDTKMSVNFFLIWCELMGIDFEIHVKNNGHDTDPLPEDLYYFSTRDGVFSESELKDMDKEGDEDDE